MDYEKRKVCWISPFRFIIVKQGIGFPYISLTLSLSVWFNQEQKQLEKLNFEKELDEKQREQAQLLFLNNSRKEDMLLSVKLVHIFTQLLDFSNHIILTRSNLQGDWPLQTCLALKHCFLITLRMWFKSRI